MDFIPLDLQLLWILLLWFYFTVTWFTVIYFELIQRSSLNWSYALSRDQNVKT